DRLNRVQQDVPERKTEVAYKQILATGWAPLRRHFVHCSEQAVPKSTEPAIERSSQRSLQVVQPITLVRHELLRAAIHIVDPAVDRAARKHGADVVGQSGRQLAAFSGVAQLVAQVVQQALGGIQLLACGVALEAQAVVPPAERCDDEVETSH